jgi:hypothetical protein
LPFNTTLMPVRIHVYALCKNEIDFLPFFFQYYENIAEKIIIYDNGSTDGSREFIQSQNKGILREFDTNGVLRDDIHRFIKNSVWKESIGVADWVIVSDLDEIVYHNKLSHYLKYCKRKGITIPKIRGFNMISEEYPQKGIPIIEQVKYGAYSIKYSKNAIFDPNEIREINFAPGAHIIDPEGNIIFGNYKGLKLLHYKYMGNPNELQNKWMRLGEELSEFNVKNEWGLERKNREELALSCQYVKRKAELVIYDDSKMILRRVINFFKRDSQPYI